jgi:Tfp pilus assembly protein PilV
MNTSGRDERGWSSIEAMTALLIAVIAIGSLAAAAVNAFRSAARLRVRAAAIMETRNGESDAVVELIGR